MKKQYLFLIEVSICCIIAFTSNFAVAQKAQATVDKSKIRLGEIIQLKLSVSANKPSLLLKNWFAIEDTFAHFEVVEKLPIDTIDIANTFQYTQVIRLIGFDTGTHIIPPFEVITNDGTKLFTNTVSITVLPVNVSQLKEYHPVKEIIEVNPPFDWLSLILVVVGTVLLLLFIFLIYRKWMLQKSRKIKAKPTITLESTLLQIDALQSFIQQPQILYVQLITICKTFTQHQLQLNTQSKTTTEYMLQLKGRIGNEPMQTAYFQLLRLADAVKFAQFIPEATITLEALETAKQFVKTIHSFQNSTK